MVENPGVVAVLGQGAMGSAVTDSMVATGIDVVSGARPGRTASAGDRCGALTW